MIKKLASVTLTSYQNCGSIKLQSKTSLNRDIIWGREGGANSGNDVNEGHGNRFTPTSSALFGFSRMKAGKRLPWNADTEDPDLGCG